MAAAPAPHESRYWAEYNVEQDCWIITNGFRIASAHFALGQREMADWYAEWLTNYKPDPPSSPDKR